MADFVEVEGIPSIHICEESEGQSVKSDISIRTVPIHPKLIKLGLLKRVESLRKAGETRLFPSMKTDGVNEMGNWLSKASSRHVLATVGKPDKGKFGFHSLKGYRLWACLLRFALRIWGMSWMMNTMPRIAVRRR